MKERDTGMDILRVYLAFLVVLVHGWKEYTYPYEPGLFFPWSFFNRSGTVAVHVFIFLAFLYTDIEELGHSRLLFEKRMCRLLVPHIAWTFIYLVIYKVAGLIWDKDFKIIIRSVMIQLFLGHGYNEVMWFQVVLILLTIFFVALFKFMEEWKQDVTLICIFGFCIIGQYSGINEKIFGHMIPEVFLSFGRISEVAPTAVAAVFFQKYNARLMIKKHWQMILTGSLLGLFIIYNYPVFRNIDGYAYSGFWRFSAAVLTVLIAESCSIVFRGGRDR
ncbi:MAG: acyltransferase [Eubacterium sp.]|nr:acyltransferase [Eubacterium sp.]